MSIISSLIDEALYIATGKFSFDPKSTAISNIKFNKWPGLASGDLDITFSTGKTYTYENVPENVAFALIEAGSVGSYFNEHIRDTYGE